MNLDTVICVLVGIFGVHTFCQRSKRVGQFGIFLLFLTFFRSQLTFTGDVVQRFVDIYIARSLVQQCAAGIQLRFHDRQHVINSREFDNGFAELFAFLCVSQSFVVGGLAQTDRLCGDTQTGTIHQRHYIFDQTQFAVPAKFGFRIFVNQLASRRTVDTQLVFNTADIYATLTLVIDEHRQATSVFRPFFRTGQNQMKVGVSVGDETFHAVQQPAIFFFVESCFQHHGLQIGAGIRLCQVHRHRFSGADTRNETAVLVFVSEFI